MHECIYNCIYVHLAPSRATHYWAGRYYANGLTRQIRVYLQWKILQILFLFIFVFVHFHANSDFLLSLLYLYYITHA